MRIGLICLVLGYALSQFYRAFLPVLTPDLRADLGATPDDLALASGLWFIVFAAMQIPVGAALDRIGPRRTTGLLFALGGAGGAALLALAQTPLHVTLAMMLIAVGCSPVLMASYFILARMYPPAAFGTLAGLVIGLGTFGNIAGSAPLAWAATAFGWRATLWGVAAVTLVIAALLMATIKDPPREAGGARGSVLDLLRIPALWPILALMFVNYAPAAAIRGLWAGPYTSDVLGGDQRLIGIVTLVMGLAMIAGSFAYGPMERLFGTRKWVIFLGNLGGALGCIAFWLFDIRALVPAAALFALIGFCGASFPLIAAHARAYFPAHLTGRGVTLVNLFGIGGVGAAQLASGPVFGLAQGAGDGAYVILFGLFGLLLLAGLAAYLMSRDRTD